MMSSEPQLGHRRKGGMLDIGDEDGSHPLFYLPFTKRHYPPVLYLRGLLSPVASSAVFISRLGIASSSCD